LDYYRIQPWLAECIFTDDESSGDSGPGGFWHFQTSGLQLKQMMAYYQ
jgi:hypothetical protein